MKKFFATLTLLTFLLTATTFAATRDTPERSQRRIDTASQQVLEKLYAQNPKTRELVKLAPGYAVLSYAAQSSSPVSAVLGEGIACNIGGEKNYIAMRTKPNGKFAQTKCKLVFIFGDNNTLTNFLDGKIKFFTRETEVLLSGGNMTPFGSLLVYTSPKIVASKVYVFKVDGESYDVFELLNNVKISRLQLRNSLR